MITLSNYQLTIIVLLAIMAISISGILIYISRKFKKINQNNIFIPINKDNTEIIIQELDKMILYHTVYNIDVIFGNNFRDNKSINGDVENTEINEAIEKIETDIVENMGDNMKLYLYNLFGRDWILNYINIQTLSLALNYTKLNISSLTNDLFK